MGRSLVATAKRVATTLEDIGQRVLSVVLPESDRKIAADSQAYWTNQDSRGWADNAHLRESSTFAGNNLWEEIGDRHARMFHMATDGRRMGSIVDWGCGGGMNAAALSIQADSIVGVDVNPGILAECERAVRAVSDVPFRGVTIDVASPELAVADIGAESADGFVSFYVFELIPSQAYGARLLKIAQMLLRPGGVALIQVKYSTGGLRTRPRGRGYRRGLASMTTYPIHEFWELATVAGLTPVSVSLSPVDELDERYAYFTLRKEAWTRDRVRNVMRSVPAGRL